MSANVEVSEDGLKAAFASRAHAAWHLLGTVFGLNDKVSTAKMLQLANLENWGVHLELTQVPGIDADRWVTETYAVVRTNPFDSGLDVLSTVGERYTTYQNEELFAFGDGILAGGGRWETAGSIRNGRTVFGSMAMPGKIVLDPNGIADEVKQYLLIFTSHDGTSAVVAANTPVRVVCQNTLNIAMSGVKQSYKFRHTAKMAGRVQHAREALDINVAYMDEFSTLANKMIQTQITADQFAKIVEKVYPTPADEKKAAVTRHANKIELVEAIYKGQADGPDTNSKITGTAWGAFNALTEQLDWYRKPRAGNLENVLVSASGFDPNTNTSKQDILKAVMSVV